MVLGDLEHEQVMVVWGKGGGRGWGGVGWGGGAEVIVCWGGNSESIQRPKGWTFSMRRADHGGSRDRKRGDGWGRGRGREEVL